MKAECSVAMRVGKLVDMMAEKMVAMMEAKKVDL